MIKHFWVSFSKKGSTHYIWQLISLATRFWSFCTLWVCIGNGSSSFLKLLLHYAINIKKFLSTFLQWLTQCPCNVNPLKCISCRHSQHWIYTIYCEYNQSKNVNYLIIIWSALSLSSKNFFFHNFTVTQCQCKVNLLKSTYCRHNLLWV